MVLLIYKNHSTVGEGGITRISTFLGTPNKLLQRQTKFRRILYGEKNLSTVLFKSFKIRQNAATKIGEQPR